MSDALVCRACGRSNPGDSRFCSGCGSLLAAEAAPREARKVLTALFADVVGSTALGERLDPEDLQEVVGEGVARVVRTVEELGGHVDRVAGDGALVLFGAPAAHEDDPERAVLAGLRILETIDSYAAELSGQRGLGGFAVRVGIETGLAVLAPLGGAQPIEFGATGDVLNTAARLEAATEPGTMLVGPRTFRLVERGFEWAKPVELRLKGKADIVVAHRPLRARAPGGRRLSQRASPLVGRERELELVRRALDKLLSGTGGVLLVGGEPGLGKTRLLAELRRRVERSSSAAGRPLWLEGRCVSYGERLPYLPFQVLLRDWLGATPEQSEADVGSMLDARLAALLGERAGDLRPFLASVLGLVPRPEDTTRLAGLRPDDVQARAFGAFASLLGTLSREGPVALALDDLHWADATSLALTEHLLRLTEEAPLLVVLASRPEGQRPGATLGERVRREHPHGTVAIALTALEREADRTLLAELVGGASLPEQLERRVLERAEGNPLYLEELVRSLIDTGALVREGGGWRFDPEVDFEVPETVEKLILARVDVLSPVARELLCAASVLGRRFTPGLLEAVAGDASALRELERAELVREDRRRLEREYRFKHHLIQEATYASMLKRRRQQLHRRAAEAIESAFAGRLEERLGVLAHHWAAAGEPAAALNYHSRAAAAAWRIAAPDEAIDHYGAAVDAATQLGLGPEDARLRLALVERGRLRFYTGRADEGLRDIETGLAGARAAGDRQMEMDALSLLAWFRHGGFSNAVSLAEEALAIARSADDERAQVRALARLTILDSNRLKLDRALAEAREALEIARRGDDDEALGWALDGLKLAQLKLGDLPAVAELCSELIELHNQRGDPFFLAWALLESSFPLLGQGRLDQALARVEEALALNRKLGDRRNEPLFYDAVCWVQRSRGDYRRALETGRRAHALAVKVATGEWQAWTAASLGWVLLDLRAAGEAVPLLETGAEAAHAEEATGELLRCTAQLAWARWLRGEREAALATAEHAGTMLAEVTAPAGSAWLFGTHAQLALARVWLEAGEPARAEAIARPLHEAAERTGWGDAAASAAIVLALCERAGGRSQAAARLLEGALAPPGAPASAWEARLELASLDGPDADRHGAEGRALLEDVLAGLGEDEAAGSLAAAYLPARTAG